MRKFFLGVAVLMTSVGMAGTVQAEPEAIPEINTIILSTGKQQISAALPFKECLDRPLPAADGELRLILSPSEQAMFKDGKLIRYTYVENQNTAQVAELQPPVPCKIMALNANSRLALHEIEKENHYIMTIHNISCFIEYNKDKGVYIIHRKSKF